MNVLQRELWNGRPSELGDLFRLTKGEKSARCALWSHWSGWELRLDAAGEMIRTQVCRSEEEVFSTGERWKKNMQSRGWS